MSRLHQKAFRSALFVSRILVSLLCANFGASAPAADAPRVTGSLDAGWKFTRGDPADAEKPGFDDSAWRT